MENRDQEIIFSRAIKAGKRIYYLDVKRNRKDESFLAITESKKIINNSIEAPSFSFEKHKIFLYQADLEKFMEGFLEVVAFMNRSNNEKTELGIQVRSSTSLDLDKYE